jgi:hypothetical protein
VCCATYLQPCAVGRQLLVGGLDGRDLGLHLGILRQRRLDVPDVGAAMHAARYDALMMRRAHHLQGTAPQ